MLNSIVLFLVTILSSSMPYIWTGNNVAHSEALYKQPAFLDSQRQSQFLEIRMVSLRIPISDPRLLSIQQEPPDPQAIEQGKHIRVALFLIIAIVTSSLSLGIAFGIRKRIDQIGGPIDDEED